MSSGSDMKTPGVVHLSPIELQSRLSNGERLTLLDVREPFERTICAIHVSEPATDLFVPMAQVQTSFDSIVATADNAPIVVYCHHGVRSLAVARWLSRMGCRTPIFNLDGGIEAWATQVAPDTPRY
jgi:rhodanese-related sulfurtransferase